MDNLTNDIKTLISGFKASMEVHLPPLEAEVNRLITTKSKDAKAIEQLLDTLLSLSMMGVGEDIFIKLIDYYKTVDPEGAAFYWNEYDTQE